MSARVAFWRIRDSGPRPGARLPSESGLGSGRCRSQKKELVCVLGCCGELLLDPGVCLCRLEAVRQADLT